MSTQPAPATKPTEKTLYKKWTKPLIDAGYTVVPTIIIRRMRVLGLTPTDFAILVQIASYWWEAENEPFPSMKTLADAIGISESTVKRRIKAMHGAKFLKKTTRPQKHNRHKPNLYGFGPLIQAGVPYAEQELEAISDRKAAAAAKKKSLTQKGKPELKVVSK